MATHADEEIPLPLVRTKVSTRPAAPPPAHIEDEDSQVTSHYAMIPDRIAPSVAGGLVGFVAGLAALGVVHGMDPAALMKPLEHVAASRGVDLDVVFVVAYVTAASIGGLVGATFAVVTRYLRKWVPLLIWALVFFMSLAMLLLAAAPPSIRGLAGPILVASAVFGFVVSFELPLRRRRSPPLEGADARV